MISNDEAQFQKKDAFVNYQNHQDGNDLSKFNMNLKIVYFNLI